MLFHDQLGDHIVMMGAADHTALHFIFTLGGSGKRDGCGFSWLHRFLDTKLWDIKAVLNVERSGINFHSGSGLYADHRRIKAVFFHHDLDVLGRTALLVASNQQINET